MSKEDGATRRTQSKTKIRALVLNQLAHGKLGKKGTISRLLEKLDLALDSCEYEDVNTGRRAIDVDALTKLAGAIMRLANLAMPTAAQEDSIAKGIPMMPSGDHESVLVRIEYHLAERRKLLANTMPITQSQVVQSIPNLSELAKQELVRRSTPPPAPPPEGMAIESVGRVPTISHPPSPQNISGTKQVDDYIEKLKASRDAALQDPLLDDLDFGEPDGDD